MNTIKYYSKDDSNNVLFVKDYNESVPANHLLFAVETDNIHQFNGIVLNAVQVDKLRQQLHGWLHERANAPDGKNWVEL